VVSSTSENEVNRADHAQCSPQIVQFERLFKVHHGKRDENSQRDDLLHDFELPTLNPACWKPIRFAGTCKAYSNSAMHQLATAAMYQGAVAKFFKCPYQANVMNTLLPTKSNTVCQDKGRDESRDIQQ
jgi:hypothetical protein